LQYLTPTRVKRLNPKQTEITWNDSHVGVYPSWYLRENCQCASCVDELTGARKVVHGSIPSSLERVNVTPVGNYALQFEWSDGHSTGIYAFDLLRQLCPCHQCLPEGLEEPPAEVAKGGSFEV
jgi:DUF971 family protein